MSADHDRDRWTKAFGQPRKDPIVAVPPCETTWGRIVQAHRCTEPDSNHLGAHVCSCGATIMRIGARPILGEGWAPDLPPGIYSAELTADGRLIPAPPQTGVVNGLARTIADIEDRTYRHADPDHTRHAASPGTYRGVTPGNGGGISDPHPARTCAMPTTRQKIVGGVIWDQMVPCGRQASHEVELTTTVSDIAFTPVPLCADHITPWAAYIRATVVPGTVLIGEPREIRDVPEDEPDLDEWPGNAADEIPEDAGATFSGEDPETDDPFGRQPPGSN